METKQRIQRVIGVITILSCLYVSGCSHRDPEYLSQWYAEHYPEVQGTEAGLGQPSQKTLPNIDSATTSPRKVRSVKQSAPMVVSEAVIPVVQGRLDEPKEYNYSNGDEPPRNEAINEYNVSSMIEGKLFKLVEDAYFRRDEAEFVRLYNFFMESFPRSGRKSVLDDKWRSFFYTEDLELNQLKGALVELKYPKPESLPELNMYLSRLREKGVDSIQIEVVKLDEKPVYLFGNLTSKDGYYFRTELGPIVDDLLANLVDMAHDNGLKVLVSLPLRHYPRLGHIPDMLMDSSWNAIQNKVKPNSKLDLLNPKAKVFLTRIIDSLIEYKIDGIVFKDDFTYETVEGFSEEARHQYAVAAGKTIDFNQVFVPLRDPEKNDFGVLADGDFFDIAIWRTREIKQLLWDLTQYARLRGNKMTLGLEVTPEMLLDESTSVMWYSTGLKYLRDLDVDFFVLKWRKDDSEAESDFESYEKAAVALRDSARRSARILLKVPLSDSTHNVIQLNRRIDFNVKLQEEVSPAKLAIGPINRFKRLDFVN